jgi:hypothetical protein
VQIPLGLEDQMRGVVDVITREAVYFQGSQGQVSRCRACSPGVRALAAQRCLTPTNRVRRTEVVRSPEVPAHCVKLMEERREILIASLAEVRR